MNFTLTNLSPGVYGLNKQQVYKSNIVKYNYSNGGDGDENVIETIKFKNNTFDVFNKVVDLGVGDFALISEKEVTERFTVKYIDSFNGQINTTKLNELISDNYTKNFIIGSRIVVVDNCSEYELIRIDNLNYNNNIWSYKLLNVIN